MGKRGAGIVVVVVWLAGGIAEARTAGKQPDGACDASPTPEHIRVSDCRLQRLVATGLDRSVTFRQLVERVNALDGIVYVSIGLALQPGTIHILSGITHHRVVVSGSHRITFVTMTPAAGDRAVATLAHELQHVIELLESEATSQADIEKVFRRVGFEAAERQMETERGIDIQHAVLNELRGAYQRAVPPATREDTMRGRGDSR